MNIPSLLTAASLIAGCTSMQPIDGSPADLRLHIGWSRSHRRNVGVDSGRADICFEKTPI